MILRSLTIVTAAADERLVNAGLRRGSGTRFYGQESNEARRNVMQPTLSSSRAPQGQPRAADTKPSPGRHPHVTHIRDTSTMGTASERFDLPLELLAAGHAADGNAHRRSRVLVLGDEADVAELIRCNLIQEGWEVFTVDSAAGALQRVSDVRPDLVLLDTRVPQLNGWEVCRRLKEDPETRAIPAIIITGRVDQSDRVLGFEVGADAVVILG